MTIKLEPSLSGEQPGAILAAGWPSAPMQSSHGELPSIGNDAVYGEYQPVPVFGSLREETIAVANTKVLHRWLGRRRRAIRRPERGDFA